MGSVTSSHDIILLTPPRNPSPTWEGTPAPNSQPCFRTDPIKLRGELLGPIRQADTGTTWGRFGRQTQELLGGRFGRQTQKSCEGNYLGPLRQADTIKLRGNYLGGWLRPQIIPARLFSFSGYPLSLQALREPQRQELRQVLREPPASGWHQIRAGCWDW